MNEASDIRFSIIICTYNREELLPLALDSIIKQTLARDKFEVILVDNNSSDSSPEIFSSFMRSNPGINARYVKEAKQGLSFARNRGISEASGDLITFMDDDALLDPDFSRVNVEFFDKHPRVNAIGGKILLYFMAGKPFWLNPFLSSLLGYFNPGSKEARFRRTYFRGSNMSFRLSIFDRYEPFNTALGRVGKNLEGSEEKEIFYRLKNAGEEIWYVPDARVWHLVPEERTGIDFIRRQAGGAGISQRKMVLSRGRIYYLLSVLKEIAKWGISILLSFFYLLTLRPRISLVLIKFRYWVSSGLFFSKH